MSELSQAYRSRLIIDDTNYQVFQPDSNGEISKQAGGGEIRMAAAFHPKYGAPILGSDPPIPIIPMEEWPERIADRKARGQTNKALWKQGVNKVLNQGSLNYCHAYSAVMGAMTARNRMGLPFVLLSAGSIGGPITNYRNEGAWIGDDLARMRDFGCADVAFVPMAQVAKSGWLSGAVENCLLHRCDEYWQMKPRNFQHQGTLMLSSFELMVGLNYWGHAVIDFDLIDLYPTRSARDESRYGVEFLNSWDYTWGDEGWGIRSGTQKYADEGYVFRSFIASEN